VHERTFHAYLLIAFLASTAAIAPLLTVVRAPYGRYTRPGWGPTVPTRVGWALMELPAVAVFGACFAVGHRFSAAALAFLVLWELHYLYRTLAFPLLLRPSERQVPALVIGAGIAFNVVNAYLNGRWLFGLGAERSAAWLHDPRFAAGACLFALGFAVHASSDRRLRRLRPPGETGYAIPRGGLFHWVTSPNYLGEIVEWSGWALATWSLPGVAFALWTAANLAPRAWAHQRWYSERFEDYPHERRVLVPGIW
jgi:3-oxo-5-alpha-steroid 4-dehydrogenase 1